MSHTAGQRHSLRHRPLPVTAALRLGIAMLAGAGFIGACSSDTGINPTELASPAGPGSLAPHLAVTPDGTAVMSWLAPAADDAHVLQYSVLGTETWSEPVQVARGTDWFVNWADFPSVVPLGPDRWAAHWLVRRPGGTYAYDVTVAVSVDAGSHWDTRLRPHDDDTPTEHGFVSLFPWDTAFGAVWLDGRNMRPDAGGNGTPGDQPAGGMTLRFARIAYSGETVEEGLIDGLVCECCQTDVAIAAAGPVVVYRDRSPTQVRDIAVSRYVAGRWTEPLTVSDDRWRIPGCPVNGPAIAGLDQDLVVAWYGAPERQRRVKLAWSADGGQSFSAPMVVDAGEVRGRVDVVMLDRRTALVSWTARTADQQSELRLRRVAADGGLGPIRTISAGRYGRNSGFPQMVRLQDRLVLAWPESGDTDTVRTAVVPLPGS